MAIIRDTVIFMTGALAYYLIAPVSNLETKNVIPFSVESSGWHGYVECNGGKQSVFIENYFVENGSSLEQVLSNISDIDQRNRARETVMEEVNKEKYDCSK